MASPKESKLLQLAKGLLKSTEDGSLEWRETASEDRFYADLSDAAVEVESIDITDNEDLHLPPQVFQMTLLDARGRVAEIFTSEHDIDGGFLKKLFGAARSRARNSDQLVDSLLKQISP